MGEQTPHPFVLVLVPGPVPVPRPALSRLMADGPEFGVVVIVGAATAAQLPGECRAVVDVGRQGESGTVTLTHTGDTVPGIVIDGLSTELATELARRLAPLRDASAASASGEVPRRVLLLDLLDLPEPDAAGIRRRWAEHAGTGDLGAPIGEGAAGPVVVDLRRDGPHGLTAGTTGAGKSELLQSYIGALAATHPASSLTFVLIDYKGGAAFKDCIELPHTVGFFTDLDAHLARRALVSLNAELRRREEILREHGCKDLPELEQRRPDVAPAGLVIVVDEFAFLKKEVPEFVAGIIDIAQRGRSLGVHLMLATQRPSGVVDDNIRANTNLRIALRVAGEEDSMDVLDRPDAARIAKSLPGRGYVRLGHSDVALVQAAYANSRSQQGGATRQPTTAVPFAVRSGLRATATAHTGREVHDERPTDLQRLVAAIRDAHVQGGVPDQPKPWLDPLAAHVDLAELGAGPATAGSLRGGRPLRPGGPAGSAVPADPLVRPRDAGPPAGVRHERLGQDAAAAHRHGGAGRAARPVGGPGLRPRLRRPRPRGTRAAAAGRRDRHGGRARTRRPPVRHARRARRASLGAAQRGERRHVGRVPGGRRTAPLRRGAPRRLRRVPPDVPQRRPRASSSSASTT